MQRGKIVLNLYKFYACQQIKITISYYQHTTIIIIIIIIIHEFHRDASLETKLQGRYTCT